MFNRINHGMVERVQKRVTGVNILRVRLPAAHLHLPWSIVDHFSGCATLHSGGRSPRMQVWGLQPVSPPRCCRGLRGENLPARVCFVVRVLDTARVAGNKSYKDGGADIPNHLGANNPVSNGLGARRISRT